MLIANQIDRIDIEYLRRKPRVDIHDETKVNADQHASEEYYSTVVEGTSNFITEIFFLTMAAHHYGTEATAFKLEQLDKDLKQLQKQMQRFEGERPQWINASLPPPSRSGRRDRGPRRSDHACADAAASNVRDDPKEISRRHRQGPRVQIRHRGRPVRRRVAGQDGAVHALRHRLATPTRLGASPVPDEAARVSLGCNHRCSLDWALTSPRRLPLPEDQQEAFRCLPEYFVEDVVSFFKFVFRYGVFPRPPLRSLTDGHPDIYPTL